jgi:hypothetical protein
MSRVWSFRSIWHNVLSSFLIVCFSSYSIGGTTHPVQSGDRSDCGESVAVPVLPIVFFDSLQADIPERYDLEPLPEGTRSGHYRNLFDGYLRVLDVLAEHLLQTTNSVVLVGYEDRTDTAADCLMARARAERVKNYLVYDRGIAPSRIRIRYTNTGCLPPELSLRGGWRACAEYRRVEIFATNRERYPLYLHVSKSTPVGALLKNATLLTFDLRSSCLRRSEQTHLVEFLRNLPAGCSLRVTGSSDNVRGIEAGGTLALERASVVTKYIRELRPDCIVVTGSAGNSHSRPLNLPTFDLPEIRYLSRSVLVKVSG